MLVQFMLLVMSVYTKVWHGSYVETIYCSLRSRSVLHGEGNTVWVDTGLIYELVGCKKTAKVHVEGELRKLAH